MKVGDLVHCTWEKGLFIYLGTGGYVGWYKVMSLETGKSCQYQRTDIIAVKKCP